MKFNFKKDAQSVCSDDPWYDLTSGGYIKPENFLEGDELQKVYDAIELIEEFLEQLDDNGFLERM